jgi:hypothetical protein
MGLLLIKLAELLLSYTGTHIMVGSQRTTGPGARYPPPRRSSSVRLYPYATMLSLFLTRFNASEI